MPTLLALISPRQASALSDQLVELLLAAGRPKEAAEAMERCLSARTQLFGRDLAVVRSMGKMAAVEAQLGKVSERARRRQ